MAITRALAPSHRFARLSAVIPTNIYENINIVYSQILMAAKMVRILMQAAN